MAQGLGISTSNRRKGAKSSTRECNSCFECVSVVSSNLDSLVEPSNFNLCAAGGVKCKALAGRQASNQSVLFQLCPTNNGKYFPLSSPVLSSSHSLSLLYLSNSLNTFNPLPLAGVLFFIPVLSFFILQKIILDSRYALNFLRHICLAPNI